MDIHDKWEVRDKRGILPEVWEARPYVRWTTEDISPVLEGYGGLNQYQRAFMTRMAKQSAGWSITRRPAPGAPHIYPEIRPDNPVRTAMPTPHWHGSGEPPELDGGCEVLVRGSLAWAEHCRKINEDPDEPDTHHENRQDVHEHEEKAKYVFPSSAYEDVPWDHDHSAQYYQRSPSALHLHLERYHIHEEPPEVLQDGKHRHWRRAKDHSQSLARRLDVHRMAWGRFEAADRVYFGIEGCMKADSILSAIIREGRNESVFSVPSVSLWDAPELDSFLEYLRGKQIIIVPDADWFKKIQVIRHARFAERYFRNRGIEAYVAAPPLASGHKGVDDFLGAGGKLDELEVLERTPSPMLGPALQRAARLYKRGVKTDERLMANLAYFADPEGYAAFSYRTIAKVLKVSTSTAHAHVQRLIDLGWVTAEERIKTVLETPYETPKWAILDGAVKLKHGYATRGGVFVITDPEWAKGLRLRVHELLRATDEPPFPLGNLGKAKTKPNIGKEIGAMKQLTQKRLQDYADALNIAVESIDPSDPLPRFFEVAESEEKARADLDKAADILLAAGFLRAVRIEEWEPE